MRISRRPPRCAGISQKCCCGAPWRRCSAIAIFLRNDQLDGAGAYLARRQWRARRSRGAAAAKPRGFPARAAGADRNPCRLRARGVRRLHGARQWRHRALVPDAGGTDAQRRSGDHRGTIRFRRNRRSAGGVSRAQRAAMRLLHAGHADGSAGSVTHRARAGPRADPRASLRQLLPLHRLSRDHRRHRGDREGEARLMTDPGKPDGLSVLDRPNSYIGKTVPRPNLNRLMQGRGLYVSDMVLPRMAHVVYLRSPHAHARIVTIDAAAAKRAPGVIAIVTGNELAAVITPWVGVLSHLKGLKSAPQHAIAIERV